MKVIAFNGSPRINGNTAQSLKIAFQKLGENMAKLLKQVRD